MKESGEMYLETIFILSKSKEKIRSLDVAEYMDYSKPSISRAMGILKKDGYIQVDSVGAITLTDSGRQVAAKIYERHTVLSEMLVALGVDKDIAAKDACKIEHNISDATFEAIKKHLKKQERTQLPQK